MKLLRIFLLTIALVATMTACTDSNRVILTADTTDGRDLTIRAVTYAPDGVRTAMLATRSGHCEWTEKLPDTENPQPIYIELYTNDYRLLGVVSATAGDKIKLTLDPVSMEGFSIERDGDSAEFDTAIADFLNSAKGKIDNKKIGSFVRKYPSNVASYAILTTLYDASADPGSAVDLLDIIRPEAKPSYYDNGFVTLASGIANRPTHLSSYSVLSLGDSIVNIEPRKHKLTLIAFTGSEDMHADSVVPLLRRLSRKPGRNLIVEHNLMPDTIAWHRSARRDTASWTSVWSGPGTGALGVAQHGITTLPHYVVADSTGLILYAGTSGAAAERLFAVKKAR